MTGRGLVWSMAAGLSVAAHLAVFSGLALALRPVPPPQQPMPESRLEIAAEEVRRTTAEATIPPSETFASANTAAALTQGADPPRVRADQVQPDFITAGPIADPSNVLQLLAPPAATGPVGITAPRLASAALVGLATPALAANALAPTMTLQSPARGEPAVQSRPAASPLSDTVLPSIMALAVPGPPASATIGISGDTAAPVAAPGETVVPFTASGDSVTPSAVLGEPAVPSAVSGSPVALFASSGSPVAPAAASGDRVAPAIQPGDAIAPAATEGIALAGLTPPSERRTAALAWSGDEGPVDPVSVAAIQSFMQPGDLRQGADPLRDGIAQTLASVPCGRLQTTFNPETGALELRGHVPDDALRAPALAAIRSQVGAAIPVADRIAILPRPQCEALTGIAATGLPQSTEQDTNPRVIGPDAQVRDYRYSDGQRLVLDLVAPDYPSFVYVDYFDAAGNVLHLQPNQVVAPRLIGPKATLAIGQDLPGIPALALTVSPPYGQEIAVAFATSAPIHDGLRPMVEPAAPYLAYLADRIAEVRAANPDFKGEWVYFFITTTAQ
ncbi:MAG: DUF4384 domain-containing protein [Gemmobacter sp.]|nr:DUF4384 domain-containing protein [Gemmobacter sp.]